MNALPRSPAARLRSTAPWVPALLAVGALVVALGTAALVVAMAARAGEPTEVFVRDIAALADVPWYFGAMSTLGIVVWGATAALAASRALAGGPAARSMALLAVLAALLCADDALLVHERGSFPVAGTDERVYFLTYALLALLLLGLLVRAGSYGSAALLLGAGGALGMSIVVDLVAGEAFLLEDSFKLLGALLMLCVPVQEQLRAQARRATVDLTSVESSAHSWRRVA